MNPGSLSIKGKIFRRALLIALLLSLSALSAVRADSLPGVMFILDASGSMWKQAGGQTRVEAAREVLAEMVPQLPPDVSVGLAAYGHRRKGDCADIEILVPPGSHDRTGLLERVRALYPKGMTPIADSIKQVAAAVRSRAGETVIVLISDGEETCNPDPCGVVRELKASGANFVLHVVGFGVDPEQTEQLKCLAEAGGGKYAGAEDSRTLLAALEHVNEDVVQKVEKARAETKKAKSRLGKLHITMPESSTISLAGLKIVRKSDGKVIKTINGPGPDSRHPLLEGDYELILAFANPNYAPPTEVSFGTRSVKGGEDTLVKLGAVVFNIADSLKEMPASAVTLRDDESGEDVLTLLYNGNGYYLFKPKPLPAGTYSFLIRYFKSPAPMEVSRNIRVEAGGETVVTLDSGLVLSKPEGQDVTGWDLVPSGGEKPLLMVRRGWDNQEPLWRHFAVPPGKYDILVHISGMTEALPVAEGVSVSSGELLEFDPGL